MLWGQGGMNDWNRNTCQNGWSAADPSSQLVKWMPRFETTSGVSSGSQTLDALPIKVHAEAASHPAPSGAPWMKVSRIEHDQDPSNQMRQQREQGQRGKRGKRRTEGQAQNGGGEGEGKGAREREPTRGDRRDDGTTKEWESSREDQCPCQHVS